VDLPSSVFRWKDEPFTRSPSSTRCARLEQLHADPVSEVVQNFAEKVGRYYQFVLPPIPREPSSPPSSGSCRPKRTRRWMPPTRR